MSTYVITRSVQVARLKQELGALHGTETVALRCLLGGKRALSVRDLTETCMFCRRAHKSLAQHVTALQAEGIVSVQKQQLWFLQNKQISNLTV